MIRGQRKLVRQVLIERPGAMRKNRIAPFSSNGVISAPVGKNEPVSALKRILTLRPKLVGGLWRLLLVAAVVIAQHGAFRHELWHYAENKSRQVEASAIGEPAGTKGNFLCGLHDALATVLGAVTGSGPATQAVEARGAGFATLALAVAAGPPPRPASRGPPLSL